MATTLLPRCLKLPQAVTDGYIRGTTLPTVMTQAACSANVQLPASAAQAAPPGCCRLSCGSGHCEHTGVWAKAHSWGTQGRGGGVHTGMELMEGATHPQEVTQGGLWWWLGPPSMMAAAPAAPCVWSPRCQVLAKCCDSRSLFPHTTHASTRVTEVMELAAVVLAWPAGGEGRAQHPT